jgi:uncharacterized protein (TIGR02145 family)
MKKLLLTAVAILCSLSAFSQFAVVNREGDYIVKNCEGGGVFKTGPIYYSHTSGNYNESGNYGYKRIESLTVKWSFRTLFGEPVIDGVFSWEAGPDTPADFLDYRDYLVLSVFYRPLRQYGDIICIKIDPTVPASGEGFGFNAPGSPSWADLFCNPNGELSRNSTPWVTEKFSKKVFKEGFEIDKVYIVRAGGYDTEKPEKKKVMTDDDFWDTPENTTTQKDLQQQEEVEVQKSASDYWKSKYNALQNPYTFNGFNNNDTVYDDQIRLVKSIDPFFRGSSNIITVSAINKQKKISSAASGIEEKVQLAEGWNTLNLSIKSYDFTLEDSMKLYYSKDVSSTHVRFGSMTDQQGNTYETITIGKQTWMNENLRTTAYKNGQSIPNITDGTEWSLNRSAALAFYDNNASNANPYGALYNWYVAGSGLICPADWHVPDDKEWAVLLKVFNENKELLEISGFTKTWGGERLPEAINKEIFNDKDGEYIFIDETSDWWSSTMMNEFGAAVRFSNGSTQYHVVKTCGFSIRCIKD